MVSSNQNICCLSEYVFWKQSIFSIIFTIIRCSKISKTKHPLFTFVSYSYNIYTVFLIYYHLLLIIFQRSFLMMWIYWYQLGVYLILKIQIIQLIRTFFPFLGSSYIQILHNSTLFLTSNVSRYFSWLCITPYTLSPLCK